MHLFYKQQLEQKLEQPHCSHILEGDTMFHKSTQTTESLFPFYILCLPGSQGPLGLGMVELLQILLTVLSQHCILRETLSAHLSQTHNILLTF